ncbi:hypothetical protein [Atopomonas sediminilitoris]|uniref:hypothetical protein n=1 Tax=Atopomonas sediminilitoris TaxID=2919919 RepID=UPI001F4D7D96|nr:hypothetical protein [Atopomonas sediminilitoris]MCJ8170351.1 hypothetical protein [Atopomonas sediminilitoris]
MDSKDQDKRQFHALRHYIDQLFGDGWVVVARNPLRIEHAGQRCVVRQGMLISELGASSRMAC